MLFNDALKEYENHCLARGYTKKTMINKRQEYKHLYNFLSEKRGIRELEAIIFHDLRAYISFRQQSGIEPSSIL
ncbi:hypothetical protein CHI12_09510 [Terribacillus saccharophilus]|uniref:Core-binding (CB) domain-containing protein n=1 Tax=Terribacillus saccharophilus TaxID=361277 RepID=A0A268HD18_9BACI|nr:hypothetical protein CHI12_09510 [Terribacillus saccharophilus]